MACPSQWDAKTPDGEYVYIRLRHGLLRLDIDDNTFAMWWVSALGYDGVMDTDEMIHHITTMAGGLITFV